MELAALQRALPEIESLGARLVAVSPQNAAANAKIRQAQRLSYPVLRDAGNEWARRAGLAFSLPEDLQAVYARFGIDLPEANESEGWELPLPARYVVDTAGIIRSLDADPDYTVRPEPEATVEVLRGLEG